MTRSSFWTTNLPPCDDQAIVVEVFGDDDDALRIGALLADALGGNKAVPRCLRPESSTRERLAEIESLLAAHRATADRKPLVVVDADALPATLDEGARWDDRTFLVARHSLRSLLLNHAANTGDVVFVRPRPSPPLTLELGDHGVDALDEPEADLADLLPYVRPLARALIENGVLGTSTVQHWLKTTDEPELSRLLVETSYENLTAVARSTLHRLSTRRGAQLKNGHYGPFALGDAEHGLESCRAGVDQLRAAGWLQPSLLTKHIELPNALRAHASVRAVLESVDVRAIHHALAQREPAPALGVEDAIERHHHAVESGDADLAIDTIRYFANDLRRLAFTLSTQSRPDPQAAASIYEAIVARDPGDAYAHEYRAFNLDRAAQARQPGAPPTDEVLYHYAEAKRLEHDNPLFVGRWLACRAGRGENITTELKRYVGRFNRNHGLTAVSYLVTTPLKQMPVAHRDEVMRDLRPLLDRIPAVRDLRRE